MEFPFDWQMLLFVALVGEALTEDLAESKLFELPKKIVESIPGYFGQLLGYGVNCSYCISFHAALFAFVLYWMRDDLAFNVWYVFVFLVGRRLSNAAHDLLSRARRERKGF